MAFLTLTLVGACTPTVKLEAPDKPIEINMNVNIEHRVKVEIDRRKFFGEGIVFLNGKLYQLTYLNKLGFVYDARTFNKIGEFRYANKEGWGLTTDGTHLIMSDGTNEITYLDPNNYNVVKKLTVTSEYGPVKYLNELEYIKGYIYANIKHPLTSLISRR